jgi:hypothetical protein
MAFAEEVTWRDEEAANWRRYEEVDAERRRLSGEIARVDRELAALRTEALNAPYTQHKLTINKERATAAELHEQRAELVEARDAVIAQSEKVLREGSKFAMQHETLRRRRREAAPPERRGFVERAREALRR